MIRAFPFLFRHLGMLGLGMIALGLSTSHSLMSIGLGLACLGLLGSGPAHLGYPNSEKWWLLPLLFCLTALPALMALPDPAALRELRLKLPLLLLPLAWYHLNPKPKEIKVLLWGVAVGTLCAFTVGALKFSEAWPQVQARFFSPFISNVRMGILLTLTAAGLWWVDRSWRSWTFIAFSLIYLLFLQAITAILLSILLIPVLLPTKGRLWAFALLLLGSSALGLWTWSMYQPDPEPEFYPLYTAQGHPYKYDFNDPSIENGKYVWRYVCPYELRKEWAKRSAIHIDSAHNLNYPIYPTLVRYLTSRGLRKDAQGISALSPLEIKAIESGVANWLELEKPPIRARLHELIRDMHYYSKTGNPNHKSLPIRIELWKGALNLLVQHPWLGIGIDSLRPQLAHHLKHMGSPLQGTYSNLNPHNQWLFLALSAGIPFLLLWLSLWFFPVLFLKNSLNSFFVFFFAMISLAMCTEDVLDTQAGVFQVVFFWILTLQSPESAKN